MRVSPPDVFLADSGEQRCRKDLFTTDDSGVLPPPIVLPLGHAVTVTDTLLDLSCLSLIKANIKPTILENVAAAVGGTGSRGIGCFQPGHSSV